MTSNVSTLQAVRAQELNDIKELAQIPAGKRFIERVLVSSRVFLSSHTGNSNTFYNEGMRGVGLPILDDVAAISPELVVELLRKAKEVTR